MSQQRDREETAIHYLLGDLSETERTTFEEQFLLDDEEFEEVEIAEGELIDRYVRNELSAKYRQRFEKMLLTSPRLVERVEFAKLLAKRVISPAPQRNDPEPEPVVKPKKNKEAKRPWPNLFDPTIGMSPAMRVALATPLILLLTTSVALIFLWTRFRTESQNWAANQQRISQLEARIVEQKEKNDRLESELTQTQQQKDEQEKLLADYQQQLENLRRPTTASIFPFFLNPGTGTRGSSNAGSVVQIPSGSTDLELRLNVENGNYSFYNASLQNADRKPILQHTRLKPIQRGSRKFIPFKIPTKLLKPGSYSVHVDGLVATDKPEDFNDYSFRVAAR